MIELDAVLESLDSAGAYFISTLDSSLKIGSEAFVSYTI